VTAAWEQIVRRFDLWRCYGDPPHWTETFGSWAARWPDQFEEWWTNRVCGTWPTRCGSTARRWTRRPSRTSSRPGQRRDEAFDRHIAAAGRKDVNIFDDEGNPAVRAPEDPRGPQVRQRHGRLPVLAGLPRGRPKTGAKPRKAAEFVPYRIR
jgi:hypothetical protein